MICDYLPIVGVPLSDLLKPVNVIKSRIFFSADRPLDRQARRAGTCKRKEKKSADSLFPGWSIRTAGFLALP